MVSVPTTVIDKGNNCDGGVKSGNNGTVRRVLVKRNSGEMVAAFGSKTPRSQSLANAKAVSNDNQNQQHQSLSRNPSRKVEQFPYRRNPLNEINPNINNRGSKVREIEPDCQQV